MTQTNIATTWSDLQAHREEMQGAEMRRLFDEDPERFDTFSLRLGTLLFDYSKNRITQETMDKLLALAEAAGVPELRDAMFSRRQDQHHRKPRCAARRPA